MRLVERTKVCPAPDCPAHEEPQPWSNFYPRERWEDGTARTVRAYCKACESAACVERQRGNPAWRAYRARYLYGPDGYYSDPEQRAMKRDRGRNYNRRRYGITPDRYRIGRGQTSGGGNIDAQPFAAELTLVAERMSYAAMAQRIEAVTGVGASPERLQKIATGKLRRVSLDLVDRALLALDGPRLDDLYPMEEAA